MITPVSVDHWLSDGIRQRPPSPNRTSHSPTTWTYAPTAALSRGPATGSPQGDRARPNGRFRTTVKTTATTTSARRAPGRSTGA